MTTEQAIKKLKSFCHNCNKFPQCVNTDRECFEVLVMAIKALEQTDGDLISRESVITMLNKIENAVEDGDGFQFNEWVEYAKDIPSAEKTTINPEKTTITDGDLISRDYVLSKFKEQCDRCGKYKENNGVMCNCCALDDAIDYVEDAPSVKYLYDYSLYNRT